MVSAAWVTWFEMNQAGLASSSHYLILFSVKICVLVYVLVWVCMWRSEDSMQELLPVRPGDQTQAIRLSGEALYLPTHLVFVGCGKTMFCLLGCLI